MTTRRGFLKGMMAGLVAVALPGSVVPPEAEGLEPVPFRALPTGEGFQCSGQSLVDREISVHVYCPKGRDVLRIDAQKYVPEYDKIWYARREIPFLLIASSRRDPERLAAEAMDIIARQYDEMAKALTGAVGNRRNA